MRHIDRITVDYLVNWSSYYTDWSADTSGTRPRDHSRQAFGTDGFEEGP